MYSNYYEYANYKYMKLILAPLPFPIILAIMFNEIKDSKLGKIRGLFQGVLTSLIFILVVVIGIFKKLLLR